ncbi:hypothetical protein CK203_079549 [Vitis vinifera]|uniref:Uncharacterized protein n=1 Tax=Vitis vinifera TaxID=29760 RepID=A0A438CNW0_VITVI|nr:hypothetical protein CK203_079549 [Vitis vinifera]
MMGGSSSIIQENSALVAIEAAASAAANAGRTIGNAKNIDGLYYLIEDPIKSR